MWWYEKERTFINGEHNSGFLTPELCPECNGRILYNGNYFCEYWGTDINGKRSDGPCSWALPHPQTKKRDKELAKRLYSGD